MALENGKWVFPDHATMSIEDAVKRFFEILDGVEESDSGREFHPVRMEVGQDAKAYIGSCRVYKTAELESLLPKMKELANKK